MKEKQNETLYPKRFYAKHFCSGVAGYLDENFLVPLDAMKQMNPTFEGKPVFVGHRDNSQDKLDEADGYIVKSFYNEVDGWLWCEFLATTQQAIDAVGNERGVCPHHEWLEKADYCLGAILLTDGGTPLYHGIYHV